MVRELTHEIKLTFAKELTFVIEVMFVRELTLAKELTMSIVANQNNKKKHTMNYLIEVFYQ